MSLPLVLRLHYTRDVSDTDAMETTALMMAVTETVSKSPPSLLRKESRNAFTMFDKHTSRYVRK